MTQQRAEQLGHITAAAEAASRTATQEALRALEHELSARGAVLMAQQKQIGEDAIRVATANALAAANVSVLFKDSGSFLAWALASGLRLARA